MADFERIEYLVERSPWQAEIDECALCLAREVDRQILEDYMKVEPTDVDAAIVAENFHVFPGTTVTVCLVTMDNGFQVVGYSACADPAEFDETIGRAWARRHAKDEVEKLLGFRLRQKLFDSEGASD